MWQPSRTNYDLLRKYSRLIQNKQHYHAKKLTTKDKTYRSKQKISILTSRDIHLTYNANIHTIQNINRYHNTNNLRRAFCLWLVDAIIPTISARLVADVGWYWRRGQWCLRWRCVALWEQWIHRAPFIRSILLARKGSNIGSIVGIKMLPEVILFRVLYIIPRQLPWSQYDYSI